MTYIRGRYARGACDLLDHLKTLGISCQVGYREKPRDRDNTLIVSGIQSGDRANIPATFYDFNVRIEP